MTDLKYLHALANQQFEAQRAVDYAEEDLQRAKSHLKNIAEVLLPEAMEDADVPEFRTGSGLHITIRKPIRARKIVDPKVLAWLAANGHAGLIKADVTVGFGKQDKEDADALIHNLNNAGYQARMDEHVHSSTAQAFLKDQIEEGRDIDLSFFGAYEQVVARIEQTK